MPTKAQIQTENDKLKKKIEELEKTVRSLEALDGIYSQGIERYRVAKKPELDYSLMEEVNTLVANAVCEQFDGYSNEIQEGIFNARYEFFPGCDQIFARYTATDEDGTCVIEWWPAVRIN